MSKVADFYVKAIADEEAKKKLAEVLDGKNFDKLTDAQLKEVGDIAKDLGFDITLDIFDWFEDKKTSIVKVIVNGVATAVVGLTDGFVGMYKKFSAVPGTDHDRYAVRVTSVYREDEEEGEQ